MTRREHANVETATIRPARAADFDAIAALTNHYIRTTAIHFGYEEMSPAAFIESWQNSRERYPWFVADEAGQVVGYAKGSPWRERAAYAWAVELGLYVRPDRHGRGLGTKLYRSLLNALRAQGFHTAVGGITLPNEASVRLHESLGFVKVAHFKDAGWKLNAWHDVGFWQIELAPGPASAIGAAGAGIEPGPGRST